MMPVPAAFRPLRCPAAGLNHYRVYLHPILWGVSTHDKRQPPPGFVKCRFLGPGGSVARNLNCATNRFGDLLGVASCSPIEWSGGGGDLDVPADSAEPAFEVRGLVRDFHYPVGRSVVEPSADRGGRRAFHEFVGGAVSV